MTEQTDAPAAAPDEWGVLKVMGHRQHAERISEVTRFGAVMLHVDQPVGDGFVTTFVGGASLYAVTIVTEARARVTAARLGDPRPMEPAGFRPRPALEQRDFDDGGPY